MALLNIPNKINPDNSLIHLLEENNCLKDSLTVINDNFSSFQKTLLELEEYGKDWNYIHSVVASNSAFWIMVSDDIERYNTIWSSARSVVNSLSASWIKEFNMTWPYIIKQSEWYGTKDGTTVSETYIKTNIPQWLNAIFPPSNYDYRQKITVNVMLQYNQLWSYDTEQGMYEPCIPGGNLVDFGYNNSNFKKTDYSKPHSTVSKQIYTRYEPTNARTSWEDVISKATLEQAYGGDLPFANGNYAPLNLVFSFNQCEVQLWQTNSYQTIGSTGNNSSLTINKTVYPTPNGTIAVKVVDHAWGGHGLTVYMLAPIAAASKAGAMSNVIAPDSPVPTDQPSLTRSPKSTYFKAPNEFEPSVSIYEENFNPCLEEAGVPQWEGCTPKCSYLVGGKTGGKRVIETRHWYTKEVYKLTKVKIDAKTTIDEISLVSNTTYTFNCWIYSVERYATTLACATCPNTYSRGCNHHGGQAGHGACDNAFAYCTRTNQSVELAQGCLSQGAGLISLIDNWNGSDTMISRILNIPYEKLINSNGTSSWVLDTSRQIT
jgi:hypothetical protein